MGQHKGWGNILTNWIFVFTIYQLIDNIIVITVGRNKSWEVSLPLRQDVARYFFSLSHLVFILTKKITCVLLIIWYTMHRHSNSLRHPRHAWRTIKETWFSKSVAAWGPLKLYSHVSIIFKLIKVRIPDRQASLFDGIRNNSWCLSFWVIQI